MGGAWWLEVLSSFRLPSGLIERSSASTIQIWLQYLNELTDWTRR